MSRSLEELEARAYKFWPVALSRREQSTSIIPRLIESLEKFIGILYVADATPDAWKQVLRSTEGMPGNLFLKHLIVLADLSGETLKRFRTNAVKLFPDDNMRFRWKTKACSYAFQSLAGKQNWSNAALRVDGTGLSQEIDLSPAMEDVAMLLIHGGASLEPGLPDDILEHCIIGSLIGHKAELDSFVRQRYIHVSRVTRGAKANAMGQLCQAYVRERLARTLPKWDFSRHTIPGISHNAGRTDMAFDIVAKSPHGKCCAIEVSFQVTTNSTIERKAGQAAARRQLLHESGHVIAYVIDGAGNFERRSALSAICEHSDFISTFKDEEIDALAKYLKTLR